MTNTCKGLGYTGDLVRGCEASFLSQLAGIEYGNKLESKLREDNQEMADLIDRCEERPGHESHAGRDKRCISGKPEI